LTASELDLTHAVNVRATLLLVKSFEAHRSGNGGGRSGMTPTGASQSSDTPIVSLLPDTFTV
jgi:hypothetical protein